jgi:two-component system KDP operon response regulator KdpE
MQMSEPATIVLVVDDEVQIRRFLRTGFELSGFTVHEAATGAEALRAATLRPVDLVIADLGLPDMDGAEVVERIRSWSTVPIIVLSVRSSEAEKVHLLELGADDYVVKPFGFRELVARMRAVARRTHARGERSEPDAAAQVGALTIGLAIVAQLAAASGGDATLLPGPNGAGTDARVRFAVARRGPS